MWKQEKSTYREYSRTNSSHKSPYTRVLEHDSTVLLHLLLKTSVILLCFIETLLRCLKCNYEMHHTPYRRFINTMCGVHYCKPPSHTLDAP